MEPIQKTFNTAGACIPAEHYMLPPGERLTEVMELVEERKYFVFYAGHQTGKTTCARWLRDHYNREGRYTCIWVDLQTARETPDFDGAFQTILLELEQALQRVAPDLPVMDVDALLRAPRRALLTYLRARAGQLGRPWVVFSWKQHLLPDGGLDMKAIMLAWQAFWREDGHVAAAGFHYREAGPHLMLMAFLQSLLNGSGRIDREYGLGKKALDLMLHFRGRRYAIEVKLRRDQGTLKKGLAQLAVYLDGAGLQEGWLVLFDLRKRKSWKERLTLRTHRHLGHRIHVVGG